MSDISIRGMEMPKNCGNCPLRKSNEDRIWCSIVGKYIVFETEFDGRRPDCPLVELPPHGNLIDKDALLKSMLQVIGEEAPYIAWALLDKVRTFPVIVHSEGDS